MKKLLLSILLALATVGCAGQIAAANLEKQRDNVEAALDIASVTTDAQALKSLVQALGHNFYTLDHILNDQPLPQDKPPVGGWIIPVPE